MQTIKLSRAQRDTLAKLYRDSLTPIDQRNASHNRLGGRGMAQTLAALQRMGLLSTVIEHFNHYVYSTTFYAYLTPEGHDVGALADAEYQAELRWRVARQRVARELSLPVWADEVRKAMDNLALS